MKYKIDNKISKKNIKKSRMKPLPKIMMTWMDKYSDPKTWVKNQEGYKDYNNETLEG